MQRFSGGEEFPEQIPIIDLSPPGSSPSPTPVPTQAPTSVPTTSPTQVPTSAPTSAPTSSPTQAPTQASVSTWVELFMEDFENGWDHFTPGPDVEINTWSRVPEYGNTLRLRRTGAPLSDARTTVPTDVSGYSEVRISFLYRSYRINDGNSFQLQYKSGTNSWTVQETWTLNGGAGTNSFNNGQWYSESVTIDTTGIDPTDFHFQFQLNTNGQYQKLFLDNIKFEGHYK